MDDEIVVKKKMSLSKWIRTNGYTMPGFAEAIGCNTQSVINWCHGYVKPHKLHRQLIIKHTKDEVNI